MQRRLGGADRRGKGIAYRVLTRFSARQRACWSQQTLRSITWGQGRDGSMILGGRSPFLRFGIGRYSVCEVEGSVTVLPEKGWM